MMEKGASSLSDGELLAILLRTGSREENVVDMARRLLQRSGGSLTSLYSRSREELQEIPGIGADKACSVLAAAELGRRFMLEYSMPEKRTVVSSRMVYDVMLPMLKGLDHEECWVMFLNKSWYMIGYERVTTGAGDSTSFDIRRIVKRALDCKAFALAIVHNHPSGNPRPSTPDIRITDNLRKALSGFGISLLDHVIVCDDCYYSFEESCCCEA